LVLGERLLVLALDTSTATASVAVYRDRVLAEATWHGGRSHSAQLIPAIDFVLRLAGVEKSSLRAVAVAIGPGSYSGLRVGIATASSLALALGVPVVQVPTLDIIAWGAPPTPDLIRPAVPVGRGRFGSARYRRSETQVDRETEIDTLALDGLAERAEAEGSLLAVDLEPELRDRIRQSVGGRRLLPPAASLRRAGFLAELAVQRLERGEASSGSTVEPIYLT
jgi:tRNA threonylcarbamoyladenosine biosynthesis protein TsaB